MSTAKCMAWRTSAAVHLHVEGVQHAPCCWATTLRRHPPCTPPWVDSLTEMVTGPKVAAKGYQTVVGTGFQRSAGPSRVRDVHWRFSSGSRASPPTPVDEEECAVAAAIS